MSKDMFSSNPINWEKNKKEFTPNKILKQYENKFKFGSVTEIKNKEINKW